MEGRWKPLRKVTWPEESSTIPPGTDLLLGNLPSFVQERYQLNMQPPDGNRARILGLAADRRGIPRYPNILYKLAGGTKVSMA